MATTTVTLNEAIDNFTGYDEDLIESEFGDLIGVLLNTNPTKAIRAAIFIQEMKSGKNKAEAKKAAMSLPVKDVVDHFADDVESELTADDPISESGKDDA